MSEPMAIESQTWPSFRSQLRRTLITTLAGAALWLLAHPGTAAASWALQGNQISDFVSGWSNARAAVSESSGDITIVWENDLGNYRYVWMQRITADGVPAPGWPTGGKVITPLTPDLRQRNPQIVRDWSDGVYVAWEELENSLSYIRLLRILPDGTVAPGWPARGLALADDVANSEQHNHSPRLISDLPGIHASVAWRHPINNPVADQLYAQQVDSDGHREWAAGGVVVSDVLVSRLDEELTRVFTMVGDESLGFYVAWIDEEQRVWVQHIAESGTPAPNWSQSGKSISFAAGEHRRPGLASDGFSDPTIPLAAGVHVFWEDTRYGLYDVRLFGTHLYPDGFRYGGYPSNGKEFAHVGSGWRGGPTPVARDRNGGAFVAWQADIDSSFVMAIDAGGIPRWSPPNRRLQVTGRSSDVCLDADTEFVPPFQPAGLYVTWFDEHAGPAHQTRAQHFNPNGFRALPTNGAVLRYHFEAYPRNWQVLRLDYGEAVAIYNGHPGAGTETAVYANIIHATSNLSYSGLPPNGWTDYGVPSNVPNGTQQSAEISDQLNGNDAATWVSISFQNAGPYATPPSVRRLTLDGETNLFELPAVQDLEVGNELHPAEGPFSVRGGRHSLALNADALNDVPESNEDDNVWEHQFIWSPLFLSVGGGEERMLPPSPIFPLPNADGFLFTRPASFAWVVALAPGAPGDDYDLHVYDDYSGSQSGYSNLRGLSLLGDNLTDFVVGHYSGTPTTLYPAAVRYAIGGGGQNFYVDQNNALGRNAGGTGSFRGQQLVNRRLADVYEANLTAGSSYHFRVLQTTGNDDLAFRIFPAVPGGVYAPHESAAESFPTSPNADELNFTAPATGWYPLVVYRTDGTEATQGFLVYDLTWQPGTVGLADSPPTTPAAPLALAFLPPAPNPTAGPATLAFDLPTAGAVRLDVFDVAGRHVRRLVDRTLPGGRQEVLWDGNDAEGHRTARGTYLVRLTSPTGDQLTRRIQLLR
jgi:hypothetical protein